MSSKVDDNEEDGAEGRGRLSQAYCFKSSVKIFYYFHVVFKENSLQVTFN